MKSVCALTKRGWRLAWRVTKKGLCRRNRSGKRFCRGARSAGVCEQVGGGLSVGCVLCTYLHSCASAPCVQKVTHGHVLWGGVEAIVWIMLSGKPSRFCHHIDLFFFKNYNPSHFLSCHLLLIYSRGQQTFPVKCHMLSILALVFCDCSTLSWQGRSRGLLSVLGEWAWLVLACGRILLTPDFY